LSNLDRHFSIKELSTLSGIKSHTIRIWEKRFNLLKPNRTGTNIRQYDNQQLRKLINVTTLLESGMKISRIACLANHEIERLSEESSNSVEASEGSLVHIEELVISLQQMDEQRFEKVFSNCVLRYGLKETFVDIMYPFLNKVGIMWCCDKILPANEHFISSLIKQKLFSATDGRQPVADNGRAWLLALPPSEFHELGLLLAHFIIKSHNQRSVYLGQDVPLANLKPSADTIDATDILTFLIKKKNEEETEKYLQFMQDEFSDRDIYVATSKQYIDSEKYPTITFLHRIDELESYL
jgi:MerR family transcriptional regulator, light-induced transcriptional regulator